MTPDRQRRMYGDARELLVEMEDSADTLAEGTANRALAAWLRNIGDECHNVRVAMSPDDFDAEVGG